MQYRLYSTIFVFEELKIFSELITVSTIERDFGLFLGHMSLLKIKFNLRPTRRTIILRVGQREIKG